MPVQLLPASAAAFAPRGNPEIVLNTKVEPWYVTPSIKYTQQGYSLILLPPLQVNADSQTHKSGEEAFKFSQPALSMLDRSARWHIRDMVTRIADAAESTRH